jgi:phosphatidylserine/phosphatidylglycerophosphate/cardiolipin synthase-like enzyme
VGLLAIGCGFFATRAAAQAEAPPIELVETAPIETNLDHADIPEAFTVWREMIDGARTSLVFAEFYASDSPGSRLTPIIEAIEAAAARGVRVRFLAEKKFARTYPETLARLGRQSGVEVRLYDVAAIMGGVLHAKYFIVDSREAYLGSQNFDWRSLAHIQELGVRIRADAFVRALGGVFEMDWALAGEGARPPAPAGARDDACRIASGDGRPGVAARGPDASATVVVAGADTTRLVPAFSPCGWLPDASLWDLPQIVRLIDRATASVRVQLLTYRTASDEHGYFDALETALRRAAARGVPVRLLLADWCKRPGTIEGLQSLQALPGIEVRLVTLPPWSGGFIPYARVIHAKYLVVDGRDAWIGTGNWEWDYFHASRNVGVVIEGGPIPERLDRFFADGWNGPYAQPVDPCAAYTPPRIGE